VTPSYYQTTGISRRQRAKNTSRRPVCRVLAGGAAPSSRALFGIARALYLAFFGGVYAIGAMLHAHTCRSTSVAARLLRMRHAALGGANIQREGDREQTRREHAAPQLTAPLAVEGQGTCSEGCLASVILAGAWRTSLSLARLL